MATILLDPEVEKQILDRLTHGDRRGAVETALRGYGKSVLAFFRVQMRDDSIADDLYQTFCETIWSDIGGFRAEGSFCGWTHTVAARIVARSIRTKRSRKEWSVGSADEIPPVPHPLAADSGPESTHPYARAPVHTRASTLVEGLAEADQRLLRLRMVEGYSWAEVAQHMHPERMLSQHQLQTLSATLRQRFARLLSNIRQKWAADADGRIAGLLEGVPNLERRLLELALLEGHSWDEVALLLQKEYPEQSQEQLRNKFRSALGMFEVLWRKQGLLTREMVDAGLVSSSALAGSGPARDRRAK